MPSLPSRRIVAESLVMLRVASRGGGWHETACHDALLQALEPAAASAPGVPPAWLLTRQHRSWQRVVTALRTHGAAVLAEPVGTGKTWIALAASHTLGLPTAVIAPAILREQWQLAVGRSGTPATVHSLEAVSRGRLPPAGARLVIVDEAHRLRSPRTRRIHWLAPWLAGRTAVFLTGTPIVNAPLDLIRVLRLAVPDDALRLDGIPSLEALARSATPPHALRRLVIRQATDGPAVGVTRLAIPRPAGEERRGDMIIAELATLRLGETAAIARLVRTVLLDAAASSDAAWFAAIRRYRRLLLHAREAGGLTRAQLRQFAGADLEQYVLWPLVAEGPTTSPLPIADLAALEGILRRTSGDGAWLTPLGDMLTPTVPTICFTRHVATARRLAAHLGPTTAWVNGTGAGIGPHRLPRRLVLEAFGPDRAEWRGRRELPWCLVLTDVGAEGLDLQGAARVVHLDLPWHPMGLAQRVGRAVRLGQRASVVAELCRTPPTAIEDALGKDRTICRKGRRAADWSARLRMSLEAECPTAQLACRDRIVVLTVRAGPRQGVLCLAECGSDWRQLSPEAVLGAFRAGRLALTTTPRGGDAAPWEPVARRLGARASRPRPEVVQRLAELARHAARARDRAALAELDALLAASVVSHPVGVERQVERLPELEPDTVRLLARRIPPAEPEVEVVDAICLTGMEAGLD